VRGGARASLVAAIAIAALALLAAAAWYAWRRAQEERAAAARAEREARVQAEAEPLREALAAAEAAAVEPYDIEKTMRVLFEIDTAVHRVASIREYLALLGRADYRRVKPAVLESRERIVDVLLDYYAAVETLEEQDALWTQFTGAVEGLSTLEDVKVIVTAGGIVVTAKRPEEVAKKADAERERRHAARERLREHVRELEQDLARAIEAAAPVWREVEEEWARLCLQRDRAYLEALELRFSDARASAEAALGLAPYDEESQLLRALALVEGGAPAGGESPVEVEALLDSFLREHPESAPALLMRGVWKIRAGRAEEGRTDLELASTRYPQQAQVLSDRLDPYRMRSYLQRSMQGVKISGMYRAMMVGACWFSPELQIARHDFESGETQRAVQRVRDHFARRRAQGQWDLVLYDVEFCEDLLGEHYRAIFPESPYLDLEVRDRTLAGVSIPLIGRLTSDAVVVVANRSDVALHNAALVLCVRFTDMQPGDFVPIPVGSTQPLVPPAAETEFGAVDLRHVWDADARERARREKGPDDVVPPIRAVLVTDEGVFRVDTVEYKLESVRRFAPLDAPTEPDAALSLPALRQRAIEALRAGPVEVQRVVNRIEADDLKIALPRDVAVLGPMFELAIGARTITEGAEGDVRHEIEGGRVVLLFDGAGALLEPGVVELRLTARSTLGSVSALLARDEAGVWSVASVE
jgi:hypothetical protein